MKRGGFIHWYILLIFVVIFYAGNILVGSAINSLPPLTIAMVRLLVASVVLLPFGLREIREWRRAVINYKIPFLLMTLTGVTFFNTFIYGALQFTSTTNVSVLEASIPVVTVIMSAFSLGEKIRGMQWIGVLISLMGAVWVVLDGRLFQLAAIDWNVGDLIMLGAVISWAVYSILVKKYMHHFPTYATVLVMSGISVVLLFPFVTVEWIVVGVPLLFEGSHLTGLIYLGVFPSVIALIFYNKAVSHLGASRASIFLNFLPVATMIGAYVWLGETISVMQIVGAIAVMSGVLLTTSSDKHQTTKVDETA